MTNDQSPRAGDGKTLSVEAQRDLLKRLRYYGDNDRDAACALIEQLGADLYAAEGRADKLARDLASTRDCVSGWVTFGSNVTEALGLRVMSPKQILAQIARLRAEPTEEQLVAGLKECEPLGELVDWREGFGRNEMRAVWRAMHAVPAPLQLETAEEARKDRAHAEAYYRQAEKLLTGTEATLHAELNFVRGLLWDHFPECCGCPAEGHPGDGYFQPPDGPQCCGCPEAVKLNDAQIVASLRERFPTPATADGSKS